MITEKIPHVIPRMMASLTDFLQPPNENVLTTESQHAERSNRRRQVCFGSGRDSFFGSHVDVRSDTPSSFFGGLQKKALPAEKKSNCLIGCLRTIVPTFARTSQGNHTGQVH